MTFWEMAACVDGFNAANGAEERPPPMTDEEFDEALAQLPKLTVH